MTTDTAIRRRVDHDWHRMQWRGSYDGIVWGPWSVLTHYEMLLPGGRYFAVQARIFIDGRWLVSPISTYPEDA